MTLEESGYIHVSGGLISGHFVSLMRGDLSGLDFSAPTTFIIPWKPDEPAPDAEKFNSQISLRWEELKNKWDTYGLKLGRMPSEDARNLWVRPLLEALGFEPVYTPKQIEIGSDLKFRFSHRGWHPSPGSNTPPVVHIVDPSQDLDVRPEKGVPCAHDALQAYLNISDEQWGIVTNGKFLRLLRDFHHTSMKGYIEFDLEAIFLNRSFSDFRALYRFAHASRFIPMPSREAGKKGELYLEAYFRHSQKVGETIGGKLRDNVVHAIEALGNGFLNPELLSILKGNETATHRYYEEILKIIYRIIFLLYTEQRGILGGSDVPGLDIYLEDYSITMLREIAFNREDERDDRHSDLWQGLLVTFAMVKRGAPALGIYPFNGMLFDTSGDRYVSKYRCRNTDLIKAILYLTFTEKPRQRISYADLSVEEIGAIYESLLDYTPRVISQPDVIEGRSYAANSFILDPRGSARKSTGSYYTNPALIQELIKSALEPVIEDRLSKAGGDPAAKEKALLSIRVCDPACGSGAFLIAASNRLGLELAKIRKPEELPLIEDVQEARRDVLQHCIYGVDLNPMAVELAKLSLWINALVKDKPLNFLDHHIKCGNSLIGTTPELMAKGIPSEAFEAVEGDDNKVATAIKKINNEQYKSQTLTIWGVREEMARLCPEKFAKLADDAEASPNAVEQKKTQYEQLVKSYQYQDEKFLGDLWTSAFFWELKDKRAEVPTQGVFIAAASQGVGIISEIIKAKVTILAKKFRFFHWHLEFPDVFGGEESGFDCVLGNPPWERIRLQEKEFFSSRDSTIAAAQNKNARERLIKQLKDFNPNLWFAFKNELYDADLIGKFLRNSSRFPLTGRGDINTYAVFTETSRNLLNQNGYLGLIIPTGIAIDDTYKFFFDDLINNQNLINLFDFENREAIFKGIHRSYRFCLITISRRKTDILNFVFLSTNTSHIREKVRQFSFIKTDIELLNPNTRTMPIFRTNIDANITKKIYSTCPILINENTKENPWNVYLMRLVHLDDHSEFLKFFWEIESFDSFIPVYEAKLFWNYNHRYATFNEVSKEECIAGHPRELSLCEKIDPQISVKTRYFLKKLAYDDIFRKYPEYQFKWLLLWRDITNATNERTCVATIIPRGIATVSSPALGFKSTHSPTFLLANLNSIVFDYVSRQKIGGSHLSIFTLKQLPVLPPERYTISDSAFIIPRVLELVYTSWDIKAFADDIWSLTDNEIQTFVRHQHEANRISTTEYESKHPKGLEIIDIGIPLVPFKWDEARRAVLRAELDAWYAKLYGLSRDELRYILDPADIFGREFPGETFRVLKEKEIKLFGEYRTKRLVLEAWDRQND